MTTWTPHGKWEFTFASVENPRLRTLDDILRPTGPPIRVNPDGTLTTEDNVNAPEVLYADADVDIIDQVLTAGWEPLSGRRGPVMHASDFLGGDLARDILTAPGIYALAAVDDNIDDGYPVGWIVMRKREALPLTHPNQS